MGRPGRKRRLVLEDEYWALIAAGAGTGEACRRLGIARTTGYYWRSQRGGLPRTIVTEHTRSSRYLSLLERERIAVLRPIKSEEPANPSSHVTDNLRIFTRRSLTSASADPAQL